MKLILFGKHGQLGRELQRTLLPFGDVIMLGREQADLSRPQALERLLDTHQPDVMVNPAAWTAVDAAESNTEAAFAVNATAPAVMARWAARHRALLVHYSTDYVFDGSHHRPYVESDATAPLNAYGRSKLAGEQAILDSGCPALVFRTSWVVSAMGNNFLRTILRLATQRDRLSVVADQMGAPTSAELLADVTALAIAAQRAGHLATGLYHLTASGHTSWYGLACYVVQAMQHHGVASRLPVQNVAAIPTADYPTAALRPLNSRLNCQRLESGLGLALPHWQVHVDRALAQLLASAQPSQPQTG